MGEGEVGGEGGGEDGEKEEEEGRREGIKACEGVGEAKLGFCVITKLRAPNFTADMVPSVAKHIHS